MPKDSALANALWPDHCCLLLSDFLTRAALLRAWSPTRHQVHKAAQTVQHVQPVLPERRAAAQVAAVQQPHKDAVRDNLAHSHGGFCRLQSLQGRHICSTQPQAEVGVAQQKDKFQRERKR